MMQEITGDDRSIQELLSGGSYGIDYYQREYKWGYKQLSELISDLTERFLENYVEGHSPKDVANYGQYFLGSIVVSKHDDLRHVVDGQQRLTSLTLILIYLNNAQKELSQKVDIQNLIYADDFGEKKFKMSVPERNDCMEALYNGDDYQPNGQSESVRNMVSRYNELPDLFPEELRGEVLPLFIYWLKEKVKLIEIVAYADEDAYRIFETMNDRGLSLTPTDMLKGYLLSNIDDIEKRKEADKLFKTWLLKFAEFGKDTESDFFKTWLRARYARKIRERKKNAIPEDFDVIGTEYHRWVRNNKDLLGLTSIENFNKWIIRDLNFYAQIYVDLLKASRTREPNLESVRYNADQGFTQQFLLLLSAISPQDDHATALHKAGIVADFIDCWLNRRLWNFKSIAYSTTQYFVFQLCKELRDKDVVGLGSYLRKRLEDEDSEINFDEPVYLSQFSAKSLHRQLARFTDFLETESGVPGRYEDYIVRSGKNAYEIEHIWANHFDRHLDEFKQQVEFDRQRNMIGDLILLPKKVNASLNDDTYKEKLPHYIKENILAQSLHEAGYEKTPGFRQTIERHDLPFHPMLVFKKEQIEERNSLYGKLAKIIWSPDRLAQQGEA